MKRANCEADKDQSLNEDRESLVITPLTTSTTQLSFDFPSPPSNIDPTIPVFKKKETLWTKDEDLYLIHLSLSLPKKKKWKEISKRLSKLSSRKKSPKQCRQRFMNVLNPLSNHDRFTEKEDHQLLSLYSEHGPHWSLLQRKYMTTRTTDSLKNRFYSIMRCYIRKIVKEKHSIKDLNKKKMKIVLSILVKCNLIPNEIDIPTNEGNKFHMAKSTYLESLLFEFKISKNMIDSYSHNFLEKNKQLGKSTI